MHRFDFVKGIESNARTYASTFEKVFAFGEGLRLRDSTGREFIDCLSCAGALPLGHNHPEVKEALLEFISSNQVQQVLDLTTPAKFEFLKELFSALPHDFSDSAKVHFCSPSGSDAVEAAIKLARYATQRHPIIAFHGAYHGMTTGALGAMGNVLPKSGIGLVAAGVHFAPFPYRYRCPFGTDGTETDRLSIGYLRTILTDPEAGIPRPAAVIVELVQGEGGCVPASNEWLRALRDITREFEIPLILDEVQTGFARTGRMFAFQRAGIIPDILVLSKAVGGGQPLAIIVYNQVLDTWPKGMHTGTFRGNQIAMVAGRITMNILRRDNLDKNADAMGGNLMEGLSKISRRLPVLGDVRGRGLMIGVEIVKPCVGGKPGEQDGILAKAIKAAAFQNGLLVETGGRHGAVMRFLPPVIITEDDVGEILNRFESSVEIALQKQGVAPHSSKAVMQ